MGSDRAQSHIEMPSPRRGALAPVRSVALACGLGALLAGGAFGPPSSAASRSATPLQRGLSFYRGKTVTFVAGSVGGGTDLTARALAPLLSSYLHATVNVLDEGQAHGIPGQDALAAAAPDGLSIGYINTASVAQDVLTNTPGFNFNPGRLSWIVGQIGTPSVLVALTSSPYSSLAALKSAPTPAKVLAEIPSQGTSGLEVLFGLLGVHVELVTGYASTSAITQGFQRGDGPVASLPYVNAEAILASGLGRALLISADPPPGTADLQYVAHVPTYAQLLKQNLPKHPSKKLQNDAQTLEFYITLGQPIVTQARVPSDRLLALRDAMVWAFRQPSYVAGALAAGSDPRYVDPVQAKADFNEMLARGAGIGCYLTGAC